MMVAVGLLAFVAGTSIGLGVGVFVTKSEFEYRYLEDDYD